MDCMTISIVAETVHYNSAKCYQWGKLGKGYTESLYTISYNCM